MELTTEQKARVFAQYYGNRIQYEYVNRNGDTEVREGVFISLIDEIYESPLRFLGYRQICRDGTVSKTLVARRRIDDCKLILHPLSAITDEDAIGVANIMGITDIREDVIPFIHDGMREVFSKGSGDFKIYQFLIQRAYAVPLFIAPGHSDNGKTAIELGLAIASE